MGKRSDEPERSLAMDLENKFNNDGGPYQRGSLRVFDPSDGLGKRVNTRGVRPRLLSSTGTLEPEPDTEKVESREWDCCGLELCLPDLGQHRVFFRAFTLADRLRVGWTGDLSVACLQSRLNNGLLISSRVSCTLHKMGWVFTHTHSHIASSSPLLYF